MYSMMSPGWQFRATQMRLMIVVLIGLPVDNLAIVADDKPVNSAN
jgi:hypothetical protein